MIYDLVAVIKIHSRILLYITVLGCLRYVGILFVQSYSIMVWPDTSLSYNGVCCLFALEFTSQTSAANIVRMLMTDYPSSSAVGHQCRGEFSRHPHNFCGHCWSRHLKRSIASAGTMTVHATKHSTSVLVEQCADRSTWNVGGNSLSAFPDCMEWQYGKFLTTHKKVWNFLRSLQSRDTHVVHHIPVAGFRSREIFDTKSYLQVPAHA